MATRYVANSAARKLRQYAPNTRRCLYDTFTANPRMIAARRWASASAEHAEETYSKQVKYTSES